MKLLGTLMVFAASGGLFLLRRREALRPLRLGRAVLNDLAIFRFQIQVCRRPLPEILDVYLDAGPAAGALWRPLRILLSEKRDPLPVCWRKAVQGLPPEIRKLLEPLGTLLPAGGDALAKAIEETREELTGFLREESARQASQGRVSAALCLAGSCLAVLVLL